jgi:hypothetical protein
MQEYYLLGIVLQKSSFKHITCKSTEGKTGKAQMPQLQTRRFLRCASRVIANPLIENLQISYVVQSALI